MKKRLGYIIIILLVVFIGIDVTVFMCFGDYIFSGRYRTEREIRTAKEEYDEGNYEEAILQYKELQRKYPKEWAVIGGWSESCVAYALKIEKEDPKMALLKLEDMMVEEQVSISQRAVLEKCYCEIRGRYVKRVCEKGQAYYEEERQYAKAIDTWYEVVNYSGTSMESIIDTYLIWIEEELHNDNPAEALRICMEADDKLAVLTNPGNLKEIRSIRKKLEKKLRD